MSAYITKYPSEENIVINISDGLLIQTKISLSNKMYEQLVNLIKKVENLEKKDN